MTPPDVDIADIRVLQMMLEDYEKQGSYSQAEALKSAIALARWFIEPGDGWPGEKAHGYSETLDCKPIPKVNYAEQWSNDKVDGYNLARAECLRAAGQEITKLNKQLYEHKKYIEDGIKEVPRG